MLTHYRYLVIPTAHLTHSVTQSARPNQVSVSVAPGVRSELDAMKSSGQIFSVQEFIRAAIDEKLERWKKEHLTTAKSE